MAMSEWADEIFDVLTGAGVRQVAYVPDMGHKRLIECCHEDDRIKAVPLTTEEEGVALLAGAWLGGDRGALLMQSSGIGNCINMFSLTRSCEFPLLMLVTMRGQWKEFNPWQNPMGKNTKKLLTTAGLDVEVVSEPDAVGPAVAEAADSVFKNNGRRAVLLHQKLMPKKTFGK
jgi:sulfopyruvate decarboxylase alpha subunit